VDVVEAFHFVEYGLLGALFYRAAGRYADARRIVYPLLAGATVGLVDELFQWYLASRVGEVHDVALDVAAVAFGLTIAMAIDPPSRAVIAAPRSALRALTAAMVIFVALLAAFVAAVHAGYEIHDPAIGAFRSRYDAVTLRALAAARGGEWEAALSGYSGRFAREDHYLTEGLWHVRARNDAVSAGDMLTAWRENLIVETYFAPLVEDPRLAVRYRWEPAQRALTADAAHAAHGGAFVSRANTLPIFVF
jgi:hypothetical protein